MSTLFARLLRSFVVVILTTILVIGAALSYLYTESVYKSKEQDLIEHGRRIARMVEAGSPIVILRPTVEAVAQTLRADITIANRQGLVTLTTYAPGREQALRLSTSDVLQVLQRGATVTRRGYEEAPQEAVVTAMVPIRTREGIAGAVILHAPIRDAARTIASARQLLLIAALLASCAAVIVSYVLSRRITAPIRQMTAASLEMAQGNFDRRVETEDRGEVGALGKAFNQLGAQLGQTIRELTQEKQKLASILTSMSEGVVAVDSDGRIILVNPALLRLFAVEDQIVGAFLAAVPECASLWPHLSATMKDQRPNQAELRIGERVVVLHTTVLRGEGDRVEGAVAIVHDITERYQLERMRRDFLANVSHELRTPLTSIRGFAQAILEGVTANEEQTRRYLQVIMDESLRLTRLVNTILDLSRIESKAISLNFETLDLAHAVMDAVESIEPIARDRQINFELELPALPPVRADRDWTAQIFLNLLENAVRLSPQGGTIVVRGSVSEREGRRYVRIAILDNGPGIPEDDLPYIWERFYKVDKSRQYQRGVGTGLGLVIVKELVQQHGGWVHAENRPEGGACFAVEFPAL